METITNQNDTIKLVDYFTSAQLLIFLEIICESENINYASTLYNIGKQFSLTPDKSKTLDECLSNIDSNDLYKAINEYDKTISEKLFNLMLENTI